MRIFSLTLEDVRLLQRTKLIWNLLLSTDDWVLSHFFLLFLALFSRTLFSSGFSFSQCQPYTAERNDDDWEKISEIFWTYGNALLLCCCYLILSYDKAKTGKGNFSQILKIENYARCSGFSVDCCQNLFIQIPSCERAEFSLSSHG